MSKLSSARVEFYVGVITILLVAFLIPLGITIRESGCWYQFLGYLYIPIGLILVVHALYRGIFGDIFANLNKTCQEHIRAEMEAED